ncbi:hypothetical protein AAC387_Pa11g0845 [Persea americana]
MAQQARRNPPRYKVENRTQTTQQPYNRAEFDWQLYKRLGNQFLKRVPNTNGDLLTCSVPLIFFLMLEKHNIDRVMKQLGLRQVIPPSFVVALPRAERIEKVVTNYDILHSAEIELWE